MTFREPEHRSFNRIGFDLDDTLAEGVWPSPSIGVPIPRAIEMVNFYWEKGYALYVFTSRPASHKRAILDWLRDHQLDHMFYDVITDKPQFDFLIDDKALNFASEAEACAFPAIVLNELKDYDPGGLVKFKKQIGCSHCSCFNLND